ncbi:MAG: hypothetical protein MJ175_11660 [Clostridia bacterium]|nr:hypothetical protein [Clostridia bacterium]
MNRRFIPALLLSAILLASVSCGASADTEKPKDTAPVTAPSVTEAVTETAAPEDDRPPLDLPDANYGGYEFRVLEFDLNNFVKYYDFDWSTDNAGELINDAVMKRNMTIEDRYNVKIRAINEDAPDSKARAAITAGDDAYDVVEMYINRAMALAADGMFYNFYEIPHISMDKPWWDQQIQRDLAILDQMYVMTGDISIYDEELNYCVYFNKNIVKTYDLPDMYQLVRDNKWVFETMMEMGKNVSRDLNGDGVRDEHDSYGVLTDSGMMFLYYYTSGCTIAELDENRMPYITAGSDRALRITDRLVEFMKDTDTVLWASKCSNTWTTLDQVFMEDRALFRPGSVYDIIYYRNMNADFGILPYPKYDAEQETYYHLIATQACPGLCIPTTAPDLDRTGLLLEALAYESRPTVTKAYYDVNLYSKLTRDNDSGDMFDIIFSTKRYDLGKVFDWGSLDSSLSSLVTGNKGYATLFASRESKAQSAMEKTLKFYLEH